MTWTPSLGLFATFPTGHMPQAHTASTRTAPLHALHPTLPTGTFSSLGRLSNPHPKASSHNPNVTHGPC